MASVIRLHFKRTFLENLADRLFARQFHGNFSLAILEKGIRSDIQTRVNEISAFLTGRDMENRVAMRVGRINVDESAVTAIVLKEGLELREIAFFDCQMHPLLDGFYMHASRI